MELQVTGEIAAPARRVWEIVTDLSAVPAVLSAVERVERLDDGHGFGVGTRWRETRTMFGREATEEMEVTAIEPPTRYTVMALNGTTTYVSTVAVEPLGDDRCRLALSLTATSASVVGRALAATVGRLFTPATRKALQRDVDDIAAAVEDRPAP